MIEILNLGLILGLTDFKHLYEQLQEPSLKHFNELGELHQVEITSLQECSQIILTSKSPMHHPDNLLAANDSLHATMDRVITLKHLLLTDLLNKMAVLSDKQHSISQAALPILENFDESLERLKSIELHSSIKAVYSEKYTLADVYYEQSKMQKWRDTCVRQFEVQKQKDAKLQQQVDLITEKADCVDAHKSEMQQKQAEEQRISNLLCYLGNSDYSGNQNLN